MMAGTNSLTKLKRICKAAVWFCLILVIFTVGMTIMNSVVLGLYLTDPGFTIMEWTRNETLASAARGVLYNIVLVFTAIMTYRITATISREETPFREENVRSIRLVAYVAFIGLIVHITLEVAMYVLTNGDVPLAISLAYIIIATLAYSFSLLFEYGTVLQTESDEFI